MSTAGQIDRLGASLVTDDLALTQLFVSSEVFARRNSQKFNAPLAFGNFPVETALMDHELGSANALIFEFVTRVVAPPGNVMPMKVADFAKYLRHPFSLDKAGANAVTAQLTSIYARRILDGLLWKLPRKTYGLDFTDASTLTAAYDLVRMAKGTRSRVTPSELGTQFVELKTAEQDTPNPDALVATIAHFELPAARFVSRSFAATAVAEILTVAVFRNLRIINPTMEPKTDQSRFKDEVQPIADRLLDLEVEGVLLGEYLAGVAPVVTEEVLELTGPLAREIARQALTEMEPLLNLVNRFALDMRSVSREHPTLRLFTGTVDSGIENTYFRSLLDIAQQWCETLQYHCDERERLKAGGANFLPDSNDVRELEAL